ncbi:hypothetical protein CLAFUW4_00029 [Fulvia fulva]|uniref:Uncharacterized protein n=1 Tax=Passalora fulva TaxID=5499 RepID=A0A9Q8L7P4_PASFU|nr:uncharacterized protein CLAFUR5_00028 [Fulvia fulva]KAK4635330.1 hypothetical protein CLAFUR4_00029 [Fulvia fulva]KAK4637927.1 hypothetical protein CLAFUR0_00029 [Fulvia fulva]UJO11708.1 hypothetical protein CLAFUR5_00028 [Fulvia fulva]WPV09975.1 hypothetical protein CLAFUW4_00029 [Fulvia fulva]WPV23500.1 hypothetical protein CLAFUW7_00029 [Fulvia fulva]
MTSKVVDYMHILEGRSGTFSIHANTPAIGTRKCDICVGVYFPLNRDRLFVAHVNTCIIPNDWDEHQKNNPVDYSQELGS